MNNSSKILPSTFIYFFILLAIENVTFSQRLFQNLIKSNLVPKGNHKQCYYSEEHMDVSRDINNNDPAGYRCRRASSKLIWIIRSVQDVNKAIGIDSTFGKSYHWKFHPFLIRYPLTIYHLFKLSKNRFVLKCNIFFNFYSCVRHPLWLELWWTEVLV